MMISQELKKSRMMHDMLSVGVSVPEKQHFDRRDIL
jgi:hypothetical protein